MHAGQKNTCTDRRTNFFHFKLCVVGHKNVIGFRKFAVYKWKTFCKSVIKRLPIELLNILALEQVFDGRFFPPGL